LNLKLKLSTPTKLEHFNKEASEMRTKLKKNLLFIMLTALLLALAGCGGDDDTNTIYESETSIPDAFAFTSQTGVVPGATVTSDTITVSGLTSGTRISVTGGTYSIEGGYFTASSGTVYNGQTVRVQHTASNSDNAVTTTTLTIGGVSAVFSSTTGTAGEGQALYLNLCSGCHSGVSVVHARTVEEIQLAIDSNKGGKVTSNPAIGELTENELASIVSYLIDEYGDEDGDNTGTTPEPFTFTSQTDVEPGTIVTSDPITVSGITAAAPISVSGGSYSIDYGDFTTANGTVTNGQTVRVQHTSSTANGTIITTTLTIGGYAANFTSTTVGDAPTEIDAAALYQQRCSSCHSLGTVDTVGSPDLLGKDPNTMFPGHMGITLTAEEISALTEYFQAP
jgi:mono/diheme cytochrome c family protein